MSRRRLKRAVRRILPLVLVACLALGIVAGHAALFLTGLGQTIELRQTDLWFRLRGAVSPPGDLVVVSIDETTYRELALSTLAPLPRGVVADVVEALARAGASLAIIDLFFRDAGTDPASNERLANALASMPTFIGAFQYEDRTQSDTAGQVFEVAPLGQFAQRAERVVLMNIVGPDIVRFFRLPEENRDRHDALVTAFARRPPPKEVPQPFDMIRFYGAPGTVPRVSAVQLLRADESLNKTRFNGKTVVIGNALEVKTGFAVKDSFMTPTATRVMPGVEVHATVVGNVMENSWIRRANLGQELVTLSVLIGIATVVIAVVSPIVGVSFVLGIGALWCIGSYAGFVSGRFIPGVLACVVCMPVTFVLVTLVKHRALRASLMQVQEMLGLSGKE